MPLIISPLRKPIAGGRAIFSNVSYRYAVTLTRCFQTQLHQACDARLAASILAASDLFKVTS